MDSQQAGFLTLFTNPHSNHRVCISIRSQLWPSGSLVTEFSGETISREEARRRKQRGEHLYIRSIDFHTVIDGIKAV
jgi:hypothetical protein